MFGKILSFFGGEMLHRVSHNAKSFILLVPFLTLSCTSEDVVSDVTTGIIRNEAGVLPVGGYDDVKLRFSFTGKEFTIDGLGKFKPEVGKGIPLEDLKLLTLVYLRKGTCPQETDAMFKDANIDTEMTPSRLKINYTGTGEFESAFIYYEGIPSKTNPGVNYTIDFEVF